MTQTQREEIEHLEELAAAYRSRLRVRLITAGRDPATRAETIEVAHEALIRAWPTFAAWIDAARRPALAAPAACDDDAHRSWQWFLVVNQCGTVRRRRGAAVALMETDTLSMRATATPLRNDMPSIRDAVRRMYRGAPLLLPRFLI